MFQINITARCDDCDWTYEKGNAMAIGSRHAKMFGHTVYVDVYSSHVFNPKMGVTDKIVQQAKIEME